MKRLLFIFAGLWSSLLASDPIPSAHRYNWQAGVNVGVPGGIPARDNPANIVDAVATYGMDPTGATDNSPALTAAYFGMSAEEVLKLRPGRYKMTTGGNHWLIDNATIRGTTAPGTGLPYVYSTSAVTVPATLPATLTFAIAGSAGDIGWQTGDGTRIWNKNQSAVIRAYVSTWTYNPGGSTLVVTVADEGGIVGSGGSGVWGEGEYTDWVIGISILDYRDGVGRSPAWLSPNTPPAAQYSSTGDTITAGFAQATGEDSVITIASTAAYSVNDIVTLSELNDWPNIVLRTIGGHQLPNQDWHDRVREQKSRVTEIVSGTQIKISPGPMWTLQSSLEPKIARLPAVSVGTGIEDLIIDTCDSGGSGIASIEMRASWKCWWKNIALVGINANPLILKHVFQCEVRQMWCPGGSGTAGSTGILIEHSGNNLIEDNIFEKIVETNFGSTGNVFALNFVRSRDSDGHIGKGFITHGAHNSFNLIEGNIATNAQSDGYHGSESDITVFRNWLDGFSGTSNSFSYCIKLDRFTRRYRIVGNIFGRASISPYSNAYEYENPITPLPSYLNRFIYALGYPILGGYSNYPAGATAEPSTGDWWVDWGGQAMMYATDPTHGSQFDPSVAYTSTATFRHVVQHNAGGGRLDWAAKNTAKNGLATWSTPEFESVDWGLISTGTGYLEIDLDVKNSLTRKANYNFAGSEIPEAEELGVGEVLASSYSRTSKPEFMGSLTWPPFDPTASGGTTDADFARVPAGYRFLNGTTDYLTAGAATYTVGKLRFMRR
jgi:hypothetical protein